MESNSGSGAKSSLVESPSKLDWDPHGISMDMSTQGFAALDECHELLIYGANKNDESSFMNSGILHLLDNNDKAEEQSPSKEEIHASDKRPLLGLSKNRLGQRSRKRIREDSNSNKAGTNNIQKITERFQENTQVQLQSSSKTLRSTKLISAEGSSTTGGSKKAIVKRGPSGSTSSRKEQSFTTQPPANMLAQQRITGVVSGVHSGKHSATMSRILENLNSKHHAGSQIFKQALEKTQPVQTSPQHNKFEFQQTSSLVNSDKFEMEFTSEGNSGHSPGDGVSSPIDHSGELKQEPNGGSACEMSDASNSNNFKGGSAHRSTKQLIDGSDKQQSLGVSILQKTAAITQLNTEVLAKDTPKPSLHPIGKFNAPIGSFLSSSNLSSSNVSPQKQIRSNNVLPDELELRRVDLHLGSGGQEVGTEHTVKGVRGVAAPQNLTCSVMDSNQKAALMETIRSQKSKALAGSGHQIGIMNSIGHTDGPRIIGNHKDKRDTREPTFASSGFSKAQAEPQKGMMTLEKIIRHHSGAGDSKSPPSKGSTSKCHEGSRSGTRKASSGKQTEDHKRKEGSNGPLHKESKRTGSTGVNHSGEVPAPYRKEYKLQTLDTLLKSKMHGQ